MSFSSALRNTSCLNRSRREFSMCSVWQLARQRFPSRAPSTVNMACTSIPTQTARQYAELRVLQCCAEGSCEPTFAIHHSIRAGSAGPTQPNTLPVLGPADLHKRERIARCSQMTANRVGAHTEHRAADLHKRERIARCSQMTANRVGAHTEHKAADCCSDYSREPTTRKLVACDRRLRLR